MTSVTPPGRPAHAFTPTPVDLLASYVPPTVPGSGSTTYAYNRDRQLTQIKRPGGSAVEIGYDRARLATVTLARGQIKRAYDATTGNLATITAPDGGTLAYTYDGFLPTSVTWGGTITGSVGASYDNDFRITSTNVNGTTAIAVGYDPDGFLIAAGDLTVTRDPQHGGVTGTALGAVTTSRTYSEFGQAATRGAAFGAASIFANTYTYDQLGRLVQKVETVEGQGDTYTYAYGLRGLTEVRRNGTLIGHYEYDDNGNRLAHRDAVRTVTATYDDQDRLTLYDATTYAYTASGELLRATTSGDITTYQYDELGNLLAVTLPGNLEVSYLIDGQNRRLGKRRNGTLVQGFLYQGRQIVAELDGGSQVVSRFVYATGANVPDYMIKGTNIYRIIADHLGSPRLVIDVATGTTAQRIAYDEFGNVIEDTLPGFQPFGFAGGLYDQDTRLTRFGVRDYDARTGRWTAKDRIGFLGGSSNFYSYAANDPVNFVDPTGLTLEEAVTSAISFTGELLVFGPIIPFLPDRYKLPIEEGISNFAAGFGDQISIGISNTVRNFIADAFGFGETVAKDSVAYLTGCVAGVVHQIVTIALLVSAAAEAGAAAEAESTLAKSPPVNGISQIVEEQIIKESERIPYPFPRNIH